VTTSAVEGLIVPSSQPHPCYTVILYLWGENLDLSGWDGVFTSPPSGLTIYNGLDVTIPLAILSTTTDGEGIYFRVDVIDMDTNEKSIESFLVLTSMVKREFCSKPDY